MLYRVSKPLRRPRFEFVCALLVPFLLVTTPISADEDCTHKYRMLGLAADASIAVGATAVLLALAHWRKKCVEEGDTLADTVKRNRFRHRRGIQEYADDLGNDFVRRLDSLGPSDHWLDGGSGDGVAIEEYLQGKFFSKPATERAKVTGITVTAQRSIPDHGGRLHSLTGRFLEDIPNEEIGKADIITDLFGAFSYAPQADKVLNKYLSLLKPNGVIYILWIPFKNSVSTANGTLPLREWLARQKGIEVEGENSMRIRKVPGTEASLEPLTIETATPNCPPIRVYRSGTSPSKTIEKPALLLK